MGMSQEKMGEAIGVAFQQVQKYEKGANRVSASMLWQLSRVLDVPVSFFMDGFDTATPPSDGFDRFRGSLEIARVYNQLPPNLQDYMLDAGKALLRSANAVTSTATDLAA
ncbi:transcriptional regulator [Nitrospirillum viridazoti CBAmc]|uniref:Transcriptional regulator n=2 Tax=Nitrospirillum TaxID=1543705 RepID=A0A248JUR7_9PROT|nr:transcriptional regulator [Nitrospirillum amazonense CBAmc]